MRLLLGKSRVFPTSKKIDFGVLGIGTIVTVDEIGLVERLTFRCSYGSPFHRKTLKLTWLSKKSNIYAFDL
jgi:hypothetical protein